MVEAENLDKQRITGEIKSLKLQKKKLEKTFESQMQGMTSASSKVNQYFGPKPVIEIISQDSNASDTS